MFEGKPPRPRDAQALDDEQPDIDALRPLSWSDLVARLTAARDSLLPHEGEDSTGEASFDAGSARRIAAHHNGKQDVNLDASGNGKGHAGTAPAAALGPEPGGMRK